MKLPEIGQSIGVMYGKDLCRDFHLDYLVDRIESREGAYRKWVFDGCSGVNDARILRLIYGSRWRKITYICCLTHDLQYAYGNPRSEFERKIADRRFLFCLQEKAHVSGWQARIFYRLVRICGAGWLRAPFSWGFANG